ncbi:cyclase [Glaciihabitans tibetensis]|uniref:Cyclase n=1 Tax=Glaciihabitans tibetensis TaxID=1266600 RepID=A0A2T0VK18_9MICO|nr:TcmI family type II polyketide cyclase [Glaciihabitans tibetensis]PRY70567.1 cyclase [Glaciihabitans tibetensis]
MQQIMIVAKMRSQDAPAVADIFARSDATSMPQEIGVIGRSLYRFHGIYVHLIDFAVPASDAMRTAQRLPSFRAVSDELRPHIEPYDPNWASPLDAMADRFYHWTPPAPQG